MKETISNSLIIIGLFIVACFLAIMTTNLAFSQPIPREQFFYSKKLNDWLVIGKVGDAITRQNPVCVAATEWGVDDMRSRIMIVSDLADGELYISAGTYGWNIKDQPGKYQLRLNMTNGDTVIIGHFIDYYLMDQRSIVIPQLPPEIFLPALVGSTKMEFVMPGSIGNISVEIENGAAIVNTLVDCIDSVKKGARAI